MTKKKKKTNVFTLTVLLLFCVSLILSIVFIVLNFKAKSDVENAQTNYQSEVSKTDDLNNHLIELQNSIDNK